MTDNPGGIETYLMNVMHELKKQNVTMDFICDFPTIAYKEKILENDSRIYFIPAKRKSLFKHWKDIFGIVKKHKEYRTVYFNILDAGAVFSMAIPWLLGRKIVVHSHNGETDKKRLHKLCRPFMVFVADEYLACSKVASEFMFGKKKEIQKKVLYIPNAINMEKYAYNEAVRNVKRMELEISKNQKVICHVGRLSMQKNPFGMLDIIAEVIKKDKNTILLSVGSGELEADVKEYAFRLGIEDNVRFLGKRSDVEELMQVADVFFLPSFYEGLPIVALEAQAAGLRCVLSSNITKETDITGNVCFVNINESNEMWAETLLTCAGMPRCNVKKILSESEFNIKNFDRTILKLKKVC